jgi:NAD(P)H-binding
MILVVGSTGLLGGGITSLLLERDGGDGVRVLVRSEEAWRGNGGTVERVRGDLKDADSLVRARENVDTVVTTANSAGRDGDDTVESVDRRGNHDLIEAAARAGVRRFVFVCMLGRLAAQPCSVRGREGRDRGAAARHGHELDDPGAGRLHGRVVAGGRQGPSPGGISSAPSKKPWAARWTCGRFLPAIPFPGCPA